MSLTKGTKLGPYEVDSLLGAGGMGEVYRARDSRLDRIVAIKVLPSGLTANSEARARFEREARAVSALSNPHICAIYDVGRADDTEYLVMEYLEGETLSDRIARGSLPLSHVLRYGAEIAEALQHAHRAGITHRDLKPGNIMLTSSGVKLLDFGLAKLSDPGMLFSPDAPTAVNPITAEGAILGTLAYMSPEQLEGKNVDHRTDIFSLGCILYEMTTGCRPFTGGSQVSVIAAILHSDPPPLRSLQPTSPPALERIILTALDKNPEDRWQTAHDVARQLRWLAESSTSSLDAVHASAPAAPVSAAPGRRRLAIAIVIAGALGGLLAWGALRSLSPAVEKPLLARLTLSMPADIRPIPSPESPNLALSPDGRTLCFLGAQGGTRALFLRRLDSLAVTRIDGTENAWAPFWSSDGESVGFSARGKLWKIRIGGNAVAEPICDVDGGGAVASWVGNVILFSSRPQARKEIYAVSSRGGTAVPKTTVAAGEWRHAFPLLLPGGRHFLYLASTLNSIDRRVVLASIDSPKSSVLLRNVSQLSVVGPDQLAFVRDGKLLTQRFNADTASMLDEPVLVADDVDYFYPSGRGDFDAANGVIVYRTNTRTGRLVETDRGGNARIVDEHGPFDDLSLSYSPDGKRAAVTVLNRATGLGDIWIYDLARAVRDRLTNEPGLALTPVWSPDSGTIIYSAAAAGTLPHLVRKNLSSSASENLTGQGTFQFAGSYSGNGQSLFYWQIEGKRGTDIFRIDLKTKRSETLLASEFNELDPQISPDDRWLAFSSDATGGSEIYLKSMTADIAQIRVSTNGGSSPRWSRNGAELIYLSPQNDLMSVVPRGGDWNDATITKLFPAPPDTLRYAVRPDGQSFLFVQGAPGPTDAVLHLILGWR